MSKSSLTWLIYLIFSTYMYGCASDSNDQVLMETNTQLESSSIHESMFTDNGQTYEKQIKIINDEATYKSELVKYSNNEPQLVEFSENQILLISMGTRPNTAYAIEVTSVVDTSEEIKVGVSYVVPTDSCPADDAITNPYLFLLIPSINPIVVSESIVEACRT